MVRVWNESECRRYSVSADGTVLVQTGTVLVQTVHC